MGLLGKLDGKAKNGEIFLLWPKGDGKSRNAHGETVSATRGPINKFRNIPNSRQKGDGEKGMVCLRCGEPVHFWRQCPEPYRPNLTRPSGAGKTQGGRGVAKVKAKGTGGSTLMVEGEEGLGGG